MLRIVSWLWAQPGGRVTYTPEHVRIWAGMIRRNLTIPHSIAIVTDVPGDYGDVEVIAPPRDFEDVRIPTWGPDKPQCLRRLALYRPDAGEVFGGDRLVQIDLDCVVGANLDPLLDVEVDFKMFRGTNAKRPYNGSLVYLRAGARTEVYTRFTPLGAAVAGQNYIGSDQAWISHVLGSGEATWGVEDGVHVWGSRKNIGKPHIMFFLGNPKPWDREPQQNAWVAWNWKAQKR